MKPYQTEFLKLALAHDVLRFGAFTLKSGRVSPYFFNLGRISSGAALRVLGRSYAAALDASGIEFDLLFGPAYKGIPLAVAVSLAYAEQGRDVPFAYNRKEAKDHGEGGVLVGADVNGRRAVIVDDVLTAGTALRQSIATLRAAGATPAAALIALDREERGGSGLSAVAELAREEQLPVQSLVAVGEILEYLARHTESPADPSVIESIRAYQARYGAVA